MEFSSKLPQKKMVEVVVWRYTNGSERESERGVCVCVKRKEMKTKQNKRERYL